MRRLAHGLGLFAVGLFFLPHYLYAQAASQSAVIEAAKRMRSFGAMPTGGRGYPSGDRRAYLIEQCAGSIKQTPMTRPTGG